MAEVQHTAEQTQPPKSLQTWQGPIACLLLAIVGAMGTDISPSMYYPDLSHYIPRYVILAFAIGLGISAIRSKHRLNRLIGIAVVVAGGWMVAYIISECLRY